MEERISVISIIVENKENIPEINKILTQFGDYIIGRIGVPHYKKKMNIISIVIDSPQDVNNELCDKIKKLDGVHLL